MLRPAPPPRGLPLALLLLLSLQLAGSQPVRAPIHYPVYGEVVERLHALRSTAPSLVRLYSAQSRYGLASPGSCGLDAARAAVPCEHWVLELTNFSWDAAGGLLPEDVAHRPQVFLSGNLHGDETVGPVTLLTAAEHLVRMSLLPNAGEGWAAAMLNTRRLIIMVVTNPLGYHARVRSENGMDPNRDFPYNQRADMCMLTMTARAVNEVWRDNLIQSAITFHGGMQAIAYEWGSMNHMVCAREKARGMRGGMLAEGKETKAHPTLHLLPPPPSSQSHSSESPDDRAQYLMSHIMGNMAGAYRGERYPVDRINPLVYSVDGGMEDWAYAGSWDTSVMTTCTPSTYGGYAADRSTAYGDAVLRAFNVLVEASDIKRPIAGQLGAISEDASDALRVEGPDDGHVPRNLRLTYAAIDLAAPYLRLTRFAVARASAGAGASTAGGSPQRRRAAARVERGLMGADAQGLDEGFTLTPEPIKDDVDTLEHARGYAAVQGLSRAHARAHLQRVREGRSRGESSGASPADAASERPADDGLTVNASERPARALSSFADGIPAAYTTSDAPTRLRPACHESLTSGAPASSCHAHSGAYDRWLSLSGGAAEVSLGWDVGGCVSVDATGVLLASWDARVPPAFLTGAPVHEPENLSPAAGDPRKAAAAARLSADYGLSPAQAEVFVADVHAWQLLAAGRLRPRDLGAAAHLARAQPPPAQGVSRWVFGNLGAQPTADADGAPMGAAAGAPAPGSPDLMAAPWATRFSHCLRVWGGPGGLPQFGECAGEPSAAAAGGAGVHTLLLIPFAAVDGNWRDQVSPDPPGMPPQSHLVNARTTGDWSKSNAGYTVQGRLHAIGAPLFVGIELAPPAEEPGVEPVASATTTPLGTPTPSAVAPSSSPAVSGTPVATPASSQASTPVSTPASTPAPSVAPSVEPSLSLASAEPVARDEEGNDVAGGGDTQQELQPLDTEIAAGAFEGADVGAGGDPSDGALSLEEEAALEDGAIEVADGEAVDISVSGGDEASATREHTVIPPAEPPSDDASSGLLMVGLVTAALALGLFYGAGPATRALRGMLGGGSPSASRVPSSDAGELAPAATATTPSQGAGGGAAVSAGTEEEDVEAEGTRLVNGSRGTGGRSVSRQRGARAGRPAPVPLARGRKHVPLEDEPEDAAEAGGLV